VKRVGICWSKEVDERVRGTRELEKGIYKSVSSDEDLMLAKTVRTGKRGRRMT